MKQLIVSSSSSSCSSYPSSVSSFCVLITTTNRHPSNLNSPTPHLRQINRTPLSNQWPHRLVLVLPFHQSSRILWLTLHNIIIISWEHHHHHHNSERLPRRKGVHNGKGILSKSSSAIFQRSTRITSDLLPPFTPPPRPESHLYVTNPVLTPLSFKVGQEVCLSPPRTTYRHLSSFVDWDRPFFASSGLTLVSLFLSPFLFAVL